MKRKSFPAERGLLKKKRPAESLVESAAAALRGKILSGEIPPDTHLQELNVGEMLGISRTPVRVALVKLANEGLLVPGPWRGYKVRNFTLSEVANAYSVRAVLEGMVCRTLAEVGITEKQLSDLRQILNAGDVLFQESVFKTEHLRQCMRINHQFHAALMHDCRNDMLVRALELCQSVPLAHPNFVGDYQLGRGFRDHLLQGQHEHYRILRAIQNRQSSRAEALMREHVTSASEEWLARIGESQPSQEDPDQESNERSNPQQSKRLSDLLMD